MLTAYQKEKIMNFVESRVIFEQKLESFHEFPDGECDWDYDEALRAKGEDAIECIKYDGLYEWTDLPDELAKEAIDFIDKKTSYFISCTQE